MAPRRITPAELASVLPRNGRVFVQACSAESQLLHAALEDAGDRLGALTFTGVFVPGLNRKVYLFNAAHRVETLFVTPELKKAPTDAVRFLPYCYEQALAHFQSASIDTVLFEASPPDDDGVCSFGPVADFLPEIWRSASHRIVHINPLLPRTRGHGGIPWGEISAYVEADAPLLTMTDGTDEVSDMIAEHVAGLVSDGATLQIGLGRVPGATLRALTQRRGLRIHSGLIGDGVVDLLDAGALAAGASVVAGVAIGSKRLYDRIDGPEFSFRSVAYTHSAHVLAKIPFLVTINSAIEVDLFGQVYSEATSRGLASGPGGASDFARGARLARGSRIIALPSSAGEISRIVPPGAGAGPISLGRFDIDFVATEHGVADLRAGDYEARARALIGVAAPAHREGLDRAWAASVARR